jgi:hypothetical protein
MESKNLTAAIVSVMRTVRSIEKNTQVGNGNFGYKGVSDKDVKQAYRQAMTDNGLCILPIEINEETDVFRYVEKAANEYGKEKHKMNVFTKVKTKYLLLHESGESKEIAGLGYGVDSADKSAGKATTYAMKYALLYTFMTPTGDIEDTDNDHSENNKHLQSKAETPKPVAAEEPTESEKEKVLIQINNCKTKAELNGMIKQIRLAGLMVEAQKKSNKLTK